jgi:hypothetical protein
MVEYPVPTTGSVAPLPTMMEEGKVEEGDMVTIPELAAMWEEAPESITQSEEVGGGVRETVLKALARECKSQGEGAGGSAWVNPRASGGAW